MVTNVTFKQKGARPGDGSRHVSQCWTYEGGDKMWAARQMFRLLDLITTLLAIQSNAQVSGLMKFRKKKNKKKYISAEVIRLSSNLQITLSRRYRGIKSLVLSSSLAVCS